MVKPRTIDFYEGAPKTIADLIVATIEREQLHRDLTTNPGPEEFLEIIAGSEWSQTHPDTLFDRSCFTALLGRRDAAIDLLAQAELKRRETMLRWKASPFNQANLALNLHLSAMLRNGEDVTAELRRCCHANALALRFVPAPLQAL